MADTSHHVDFFDHPTRYNGRMAISIETYPHVLACHDAVVRLAKAARAESKRPVLIVPSYSQQLAAQQWLAQRGEGFAVTVTTLWSWTEDLWGLFGDGTPLVSGEVRIVELWKLLNASETLQASAGTLKLLNNLAAQALPAIDNPAQLSQQEQAAVSLLRSYRTRLRSRGLTEPSEALTLLSTEKTLARYAPIVFGSEEDELTFVQHSFLDAASAVLVRNAMTDPVPTERADELVKVQSLLFQRGPGDAPANPSGSVRFALSAGPTASRRIVCKAVLQALENGCKSVVVTAKDPCATFDFAMPLLKGAGVSCALDALRKVGETDAGRALADLGSLVATANSTDPLDATTSLATDFAFNPFSGVGTRSAFKTDKMHRGDRLTEQGTILTDLAGDADDMLSGVINRIEEHLYDDALDSLQAYLDKRFANRPAYRAEQSRALDALRSICAVDPAVPLDALSQMIAEAPVVCSVGTAEGAQVVFTTQAKAASLEPGSVDCVVLTDLNAADYPVKEPENALFTLMGKLGVAVAKDPLAHTRATFYSALQAARKRVVLQRNLNDEEGNAAQPATVFEELLDCYRTDTRSDSSMDRTLGITENLVPFAIQTGEEDALSNLGAHARNLHAVPLPQAGEISPGNEPFIVLPHRYKEGYFDGLDVSPTQVESYLACPYCWFAKRRLRLGNLDEGFSALERGTFVHSVLRHFYLRFQQEVRPKVTLETMDAARRIMTETFEEICAEQPFASPGNRYVPRTAWEKKEQEGILQKLLDYLEMEAALLPGFGPRAFEWDYSQARPIRYAGCNLRGTVDRIDVDSRGRAVVIDYKSSLDAQYCLHPSKEPLSPDNFQLPQRVQALMYSKAVRDTFGYQIVGALYVNPLKCEVAGAWDATVIGPQDIPFATSSFADHSRVPYEQAQTFDQLIDACEEAIGERLVHLAHGSIEPDPANEQACKHCPVNLCPRRLAQKEI